MVKFLGAGEKAEISNFIGLFCLKDKLLGQKTDTAVSSPDTEGLWRAESFSKIWIMVSNSAYTKMVKFLGAGEKVKNSNFIGLFCLKKPNLGGTELETRSQFSPKLFMALQCQNRKLLCQFFAQAIYLLAKTNLWNLKFWPFSPQFNQIGTVGLNWKPRVSFPPNFSWPFSVTTWNSSHSFWPSQCTF